MRKKLYKINLANRGYTIVDYESLVVFGKYKWNLSKGVRDKIGYARRYSRGNYPKRRAIYLHKEIYRHYYGAIPKDHVVDHINRNSLDNRIANLRAVDKYDNAFNSKKSNKLGHRGIAKVSNGYTARIAYKGDRIYLGYFRYKKDAIAAYKEAEKFYHG